MLNSYVSATIHYTFFLLYSYIYNILAEILEHSEKIIAKKLDINSDKIRNMGLYKYMAYLYANAYLLTLKMVGLNIYLNGDTIKNSRVLWISNHRTNMDGQFLQALLCMAGNQVRSVAKDTIKYFPIIGSLAYHCKCIFIKRNRELAEPALAAASKASQNDNSSVLIFPEGTTMDPQNKFKSDAFAVKIGKTKLENLLLPRTTGYDIIKSNGNFSQIGNATIFYDNPPIPGYTAHEFTTLFNIFPKDVYVNIEYRDIATNLDEIFLEKDKLLADHAFNKYKPVKLSKIITTLNIFIFIAFYYLCYRSPMLLLATLAINIYSILKTIMAS